uniref:Nuclear pore complex protein Nup85 n=2 Tax=Timema TaxID=61471 RepID=A0A7R9D3C6_TIMPO|nr:unnamed protein product [Timema douglasi]CAD7405809.1 unnamed protein product [Timema poppensis]
MCYAHIAQTPPFYMTLALTPLIHVRTSPFHVLTVLSLLRNNQSRQPLAVSFGGREMSSSVAPRLHEHLLLEYGSLLMGHRSLWQVGASYLDHCPTKGRACLERILPCLTLDTEARALKIVQVARDRNMNDVGQ